MDRNRNALPCASGDVAHGITVTASVSIAGTGDPASVRNAIKRAFESGRLRIPRSLARGIASVDVLSDAADSLGRAIGRRFAESNPGIPVAFPDAEPERGTSFPVHYAFAIDFGHAGEPVSVVYDLDAGTIVQPANAPSDG